MRRLSLLLASALSLIVAGPGPGAATPGPRSSTRRSRSTPRQR